MYGTCRESLGRVFFSTPILMKLLFLNSVRTKLSESCTLFNFSHTKNCVKIIWFLMNMVFLFGKIIMWFFHLEPTIYLKYYNKVRTYSLKISNPMSNRLDISFDVLMKFSKNTKFPSQTVYFAFIFICFVLTKIQLKFFFEKLQHFLFKKYLFYLQFLKTQRELDQIRVAYFHFRGRKF